MSLLLAPLAATACVALFLIGYRMTRDPGDVGRVGGPLVEEDAATVREGNVVGRAIGKLGDAMAPSVLKRLKPSQVEALDRRLDMAGRPQDMDVETLVGWQAAVTLVGVSGAVLGYLYTGSKFTALLFLIFIFIVPLWLRQAGKVRQLRIERELPDFMDVLAVIMRAGLGYRAALWRVSDTLAGTVGEEIQRTLREMELGARRRDAFDRLNRRNGSRNLERFVSAQLQAEELGVPLAEAVNMLADEMRRRHSQDMRKWAHNQVPRLTLVTTTFLFPGILIMLVAVVIFVSGILSPGSGSVLTNG